MTNTIITATFGASLFMMSALPAVASPMLFHVTVDTTELIGNAAGPFSLDFQLIDGSGALTVPNTATLTNFTFGGGQAVGSPTLIGGATGTLGSSVSLTDGAAFFNELFQGFMPGATLGFDVHLTANVEPGPTPDAFSFAILDKNLMNIPTTGPGDTLMLVNINASSLTPGDVQIFGSAIIPGVTVEPVPEPASLLLLGAGLLAEGVRRRRRAPGRAQV